jgi:hypothetical protein
MDDDETDRTVMKDGNIPIHHNNPGSKEVILKDNQDEINDHDDSSSNCSSCYADMGFMFEGMEPTQTQTLEFSPTTGGGESVVEIELNAIDNDPGAVQSGHYLWPGASSMVQFLVDTMYSSDISTSANVDSFSKSREILSSLSVGSILELGAGCGLVGLASLQLWGSSHNNQGSSLKHVVFTDHDPGTLKRASDNYEATQKKRQRKNMTDEALQSDELNVAFESLSWGDEADAARLKSQLMDDGGFDLILGSDLIYCADVVRPLFITAKLLLHRDRPKKTSSFILSQSFIYDSDVEQEIDAICAELKMCRHIKYDTLKNNTENLTHRIDPGIRIQEFVCEMCNNGSASF